MAWVTFLNNISMSAGWNTVLDSLQTDIVNQNNFLQDINTIVSDYLFTPTTVLSVDQKFSALTWSQELDWLTENGVPVTQQRQTTPKKGYAIKEFWGKMEISWLMYQYIQKTQTLNWADGNVKEAFRTFADNAVFLLNGAKMNMAIEAANLISKWFSVTSLYWPWSATPKGQPMFATHTTTSGKTFTNTLTTPNGAFSAVTLQDAIDIQKTKLLMDNGYRVRLPKQYEIWCSRALATTVRKVLNTPWNQPWMYSGTNSNANQLNAFSFNGNYVVIKELPFFWETDKNGVAIWSDTAWFLVNAEGITETKALKVMKLIDWPAVDTYENKDTKSLVTNARMAFAMDHYGVESYIVWSLWTV